MRTLVTAKQMKAVDAHTIHTIGIPSMVLMERAALWVAEEAGALAGQKEVIWAVCGTGNNGACLLYTSCSLMILITYLIIRICQISLSIYHDVTFMIYRPVSNGGSYIFR